jgi:hypothetical protein
MIALNKKRELALVAVFVFLFSAAAWTNLVGFGNSLTADQTQPQTYDAIFPSMPQEYLNYTITSEANGSLWAKIDGLYPMHLTSAIAEPMPMFYPTPPNTTNIKIKIDGNELNWINYSELDPEALHHTDIGDWQLIYCTINLASRDFLLEIHYEHPVEVINGSYTFLYDLNISPYLSPSTPNSTAHFRVQLHANVSGFDVYTTGISGGAWSPVTYLSTKTASGETATFDIVSEYDQPLHGDTALS